jgi:hypothetical protein
MALFKDQAASFKIRALQHAGCVFDCGLDGTSITQGAVCRITILERDEDFCHLSEENASMDIDQRSFIN